MNEYPITLMLIAANVIISFIGFSNPTLVEKAIGWPYYTKRQNQWYRFISSGFLHADWMHLIFNMFTLFFFGQFVERAFTIYGLGGNIAYLALYFLALIAADISSYIKNKDNYNYRSLGASGAVSAVVFAAVIFNPWAEIRLYAIIRMSALLFAVLYIVYCIYMSKQNADNVNHDAHLWGSIFGLVFTIVLIAAMQPALFDGIIEQLKNPSLFGR